MIGNSRYKIEEEIARGGMGIVLRVKDGDLDRTLAMKRMASAPNETLGGSEAGRFARFMEEAQVTAQLDHPAIVPVHDLGFDDDGTGWYTMKLVEGRELGQVFDLARAGNGEWTEAGVLRVLVQVCQALSYAHGKGVIHRDLKPANIMVGEFGEVYVMDWGLAKVEGSEVTSPREDDEISGGGMSTLDGSVMGTPEFMAPEQARGEEVDERSDVYAVGAMMYQFLTGRPPYQGEAREVVKMVASEAPEALPKSTVGELATICGKAMSRERADRYGSVRDLGLEIQRYLDGRVVQAHESGAWAEFKKLLARNKGISAALTAVFVALVGILVMQEKAKRGIEESQVKAIAALERMAVSQGLSAGKDLDYGKAAYWYHRAEEWAQDEERARTHRVRAQISERRQTEPLRALMVPPLSKGQGRLDFSPDGNFLQVTHHYNQEVQQLVDVERECLIESLDGEIFFEAMAFCRTSGRVALVSKERGRICEVFLPGQRGDGIVIELESDQGSTIGAMAFSPDGGRLFIGAGNGRMYDFSKAKFDEVTYWHENREPIGYVKFCPKGELVMTVTRKDRQDQDRSELRVFEVDGKGRPVFSPKKIWFWLNILRPHFLRDGAAIVYVSEPGWMEMAEALTGIVMTRKNEVAVELRVEDERCVYSGGDFRMDDSPQLIDTMMGLPTFRPGHQNVLANRPWLREVSLVDGEVLRPIGLNRNEVQRVAVSPDGTLAAGWETDGLLRFWNLRGEEWQFEMQQLSPVSEVVYSPDGRWITGTSGEVVQVYEAATGQKTGVALVFEGGAVEVSFSPRDDEIAVSRKGGHLDFWNWRSGDKTGKSHGIPGEVLCSQYSPDGSWLAVICRSGELVAVDRESGEVTVLVKHENVRQEVRAPNSVKGMTFSESGRWLVVWSFCEGVTVWDCEKNKRATSPLVADDCYIELLKMVGDKLVYFELDHGTQVFKVQEWDLKHSEWSREAINVEPGHFANLDVSEDASRILLSRIGEEYASLAERREDGNWVWRKILSLGRAASFFVPGTPYAVGVTSTSPSRFVMVDLRDGNALAAPLTSEVSRYHFPKLSPDGRSLAAVDWASIGVAKVWGFSVLDDVTEDLQEDGRQLIISELNAGGRDGENGWHELKGQEWLSQWREFRQAHPKWHAISRRGMK